MKFAISGNIYNRKNSPWNNEWTLLKFFKLNEILWGFKIIHFIDFIKSNCSQHELWSLMKWQVMAVFTIISRNYEEKSFTNWISWRAFTARRIIWDEDLSEEFQSVHCTPTEPCYMMSLYAISKNWGLFKLYGSNEFSSQHGCWAATNITAWLYVI